MINVKKELIQAGALSLFLFFGSSSGADRIASEMNWVPAGNDILEGERGGFITESGLSISLGVEKSVSVDGVLYSTTTLTIPNLTMVGLPRVSGHGIAFTEINPQVTGSDPAIAALVQTALTDAAAAIASGAGLSVLNSGFNTLIQNTLDGKLIQVTTSINAHFSNLNLYHEIGLTNLISERLISAAR